MRHSTEPVLHLVHPAAAPWDQFMQPIAEQMQVKLVSYPEWLAALERSAGDGTSPGVELMRENPALRLLDFFRSVKIAEDKEPLGTVFLDTTKSKAAVSALGLPQLRAELAGRWMEAWRDCGFI